MPSDLGFFYSG